MNKKGIFFAIALVFITLGALVLLVVVVNAVKQAAEPLYVVGQRSFEIVQAYAEGEKMLFFVEQAAKLAASKAVVTLGENGGFATRTRANQCYPSPFEYDVVWNSAQNLRTLCVWDVRDELGGALKNTLYWHLDRHYPNIFPKELYDVSLVQNEVYGIAAAPILLRMYSPLAKDEKPLFEWVPLQWFTRNITDIIAAQVPVVMGGRTGLPVGEYFVRPSFRIPVRLNVSFYERLYQAAQQALTNCQRTNFSEKIQCVREAFAGFTGPGENQSAITVARAKGTTADYIEDAFFIAADDPRTKLQVRFTLFVPSAPISSS